MTAPESVGRFVMEAGPEAASDGVPNGIPDTVIDVSGVTKQFGGRVVVNGVNIRVRRGEVFGFLGPNGSGKTTFIRMLCGLLRPDAGSGTCLGFDLSRESEKIKARVGYMSQKFSLYEDLTVRENLDFVARLYGLPNRRDRVDKAIADIGLGRFAGQLAGTLSGGWKQRLALTACTLHGPQLLLLDEPTAGVDPGARRDFWDVVHHLAATGITALISTHYMDEAERCHRLAYIAYGNLLAEGTHEELTARSGLCTWAVSGGDLAGLADRLRSLPAVNQVVPFGSRLHVNGPDPVALERDLRPFMDGPHRWWKTDPTLEEVFIHLMRRSGGP